LRTCKKIEFIARQFTTKTNFYNNCRKYKFSFSYFARQNLENAEYSLELVKMLVLDLLGFYSNHRSFEGL